MESEMTQLRRPLPDCRGPAQRLRQPWPTSSALTPLFLGPQRGPRFCLFQPHLHSSTHSFVETHGAPPPPSDDEIVRFEIYTDGSGGSKQQLLGGPPSWSWCLLGVTTDNRYRCDGYLCGVDDTLPDQLSSVSAAAEFQAGLWLVL